MKCPHCLQGFTPQIRAEAQMGSDEDSAHWRTKAALCPNAECNRLVIWKGCWTGGAWDDTIVHPSHPALRPLPPAVPKDIASDFTEAANVMPISAQASAALSRRILQHLLREYGKVKPGNLADEIAEAMEGLPSHLADAIDGVRATGNFAAHPITSGSSGEVVRVESGDAEWTLETVEALIDHYIVAPAALMAKREALNAKLEGAGKGPLKGSQEGRAPLS